MSKDQLVEIVPVGIEFHNGQVFWRIMMDVELKFFNNWLESSQTQDLIRMQPDSGMKNIRLMESFKISKTKHLALRKRCEIFDNWIEETDDLLSDSFHSILTADD